MAIVAAIVVAAAVGIGGFVLLGGDGGGLVHGGDGEEDNSIPAFDFTVGKTTAVSTNATPAKKLNDAATQAAQDVVDPMTSLYVGAFLDPSNWREGSYDPVWELFDAGAAEQAQADAAVLTLGPTAGNLYDRVEPAKGKLEFQVLMDGDGAPATILAIVRFSAKAEGTDGSITTIVSDGRYFLRDTGDGWRVVSYEVTREDQGGATATPGSSATPSAGASS